MNKKNKMENEKNKKCVILHTAGIFWKFLDAP